MEEKAPKTIIIIEDNPTYNKVLYIFLKEFYIDVRSFLDEKKALDFLLSTEKIPDMILLDYYLNQITGLDILRTLKEQKKEYPVILLTNEADIEIAVESMKLGALDFIEKPKLSLNNLPIIIEKNYKAYQDKIEKKKLQKELEDHKSHLEDLIAIRTEELEKKNQELKESEAKYRIIADYTFDCETYRDKDNKLIYVNPAFKILTGYEASEYMSGSVRLETLLYEKDMDAVKSHISRSNNGEILSPIECSIRRKDGSVRFISMIMRPVIVDGVVIGVRTSSRDITEQKFNEDMLEIHKNNLEQIVELRTIELERALKDLKLAQAQLIQSEKMASLGTLLAGVAHEINNPVNYINSSIIGLENVFKDVVDILGTINTTITNVSHEDMKKSVERINKMLMNMKTGVSRTLEIVNSLRIFSRTDDEFRLTNIHESINNTLTILNNQYKNRIQMIKIFGDLPLIRCYPNKIHQVFMNILANAIQSIENQGTIYITTKNYGKKISISIEDTGSGIKEEILPKIFDPFFTTKEPGKGTGLGLSIVYSIVNQHKGTIQVKSKLGKGTTFLVEIPV